MERSGGISRFLGWKDISLFIEFFFKQFMKIYNLILVFVLQKIFI